MTFAVTLATICNLICGSELLIDYDERIGASWFFFSAGVCFIVGNLA